MKRKNKLLENLTQELGSQVPIRRYNLADMITESYKSIYKCKEGSNLKRLAESHLADVKNNPKDISRLSRQLGVLKELISLTESGELKDEDLVDKKYHDEVEPKKERVLQDIEESAGRVYVDNSGYMGSTGDKWTESELKNYWEENKDSDPVLANYDNYSNWLKDTISHMDSTDEDLNESKEEYVWGDWQIERGNPRKVKYYTAGKDILNKIIGVVYAPATDSFRYGAEVYNNETSESVIGYTEFDDEDTAIRWIEDKFSHQTAPANPEQVDECNTTEAEGRRIHTTENLKEVDDPELTDEELEELAKHLETIRKDRKNASTKSEPMTETKEELKEDSGEGRVCQVGIDIYFHNDVENRPIESKISQILQDAGFDVVGCMFSDTSWTPEEYGINDLDREGTGKYTESCNSKVVESRRAKMTESYTGLGNFKKQSESKAFYKTFKKMHGSLKEGKALTRKESIDLYKASNSALTQMSIELEHNPDFLDTFKESVAILSKDVNSLLESLTRGKAPSKSTMKSLARFSEALLESSGVYYPNGEEVPEGSVDMDKALDRFYGIDRDPDNSTYTVEEKQKAINYWIKKTDGLTPFDKVSVDEAEGVEDEELEIPVEDNSEDFVGDDEGDIQSEEADEFDQDYADARFEAHTDLESQHSDSEDPEVQDKLEQDRVEVANLPGISDEQVEQLNGESTEEVSDEEDSEETPEEDIPSEEDEVVDDITDDELAELKKHLQEMRSSKLKESAEDLCSQVKKALDDAGIRYSTRGRDMLVVASKDLVKASEIRNKIDPKYTVTVASLA